jgi:GH18 family chitinase
MAAAVTFGLSASTAACSPVAESPQPVVMTRTAVTHTPRAVMVDPLRANNHELNVYVPSWLSDEACRKLATELPTDRASRLIIAFATVTAKGTVTAPTITPSCSRMVDTIGNNSTMSMAIGGYNPKQLAGWAVALAEPDAFTKTAIEAAAQLSKQLWRPVTGLDLDMEFPTAAQAEGMTRLIRTLRTELPDAKLTMAVPAEGLFIPVKPLVKYIDGFNIMTYDKDGPWSARTGDLAPASWAVACVKQWVTDIGDPSKAIVGFPAYGYTYPGSTKRGTTFNPKKVRSILLSKIPPPDLSDANTSGVDEAVIDGAWTSFVSPAQMRWTEQEVLKIYPKIGGAMVWSAQGATAAVLNNLGRIN